MKKLSLTISFVSLILLIPLEGHTAYLFKNGKLMKTDEVATMSVQEHYSVARDAYENHDWDKVIQHSLIVVKNFASTPFGQEGLFYLGVGYFHIQEYEYANKFLTQYLKKQAAPKFFEEVIQYKFKIAENYHHGAKKHVLGWESMPKWVPAREEALHLYEEVITALPHQELAAQALFGKAKLLLKEEEFKSSIETYQILIRRFPKHPLAAESYIGIGEAYLIRSQMEYPDQDYLDLAEINLRKFRYDFPGEERVAVAEKLLLEMKEVFASDLYDTARFYERTKKPQAAYIYYTRIVMKYSETKVCELAQRRLNKLPNQQKTLPEESKEPVIQELTPLILPPPTLNLPLKPEWTVEAADEEQSSQFGTSSENMK